ncbi:tRNA pseudouridine synthase-like 1 isoform X4 [Sapajus apella]|uniref:tRNA pseudouridine synthase n=1 Tax=Sapajus apella TaxID=9515 RepID=A0A6J3GJ58_SAPAP|nr:tRNA pseudouridine synthase-like 1 isoform X4 [Sapajus apella]
MRKSATTPRARAADHLPCRGPGSAMGSAPAAGSVRARYLVYFQYVGTDFNGVAAVRGAQRAVGVQNYLEEAAERLNSVEPVRFTISSRTDAGVHALSNAAHLDVQRRPGRPPFPPEVLTEALNTHLRHPAIRVLRAFRVPSDFHARHAATSRTYLYRLVTGCHRSDELPVFERNLCWALRADRLDVAAMQEAAQHLLGTHDFSAFQSAGSPVPSPVRTLRRVSVSPGLASPLVTPQESRKLQFWSLEFESQSFLYRQMLLPAPCRGHSLGATNDPGRSAKIRPPQGSCSYLGPTALLPYLQISPVCLSPTTLDAHLCPGRGRVQCRT